MPVEVAHRGVSQTSQPGRTGEWGTYPGGGLGGGFDLPLSRHSAFKHTAVPSLCGLKPKFNPWTREARYYAQGIGLLSVFVSGPPQYIPVGELDTDNSVLVARGFSRERVPIIQRHGFSYQRLSRARVIRVYSTGVPHRGTRGTLSLRGTALNRLGPNPTSLDALTFSR